MRPIALAASLCVAALAALSSPDRAAAVQTAPCTFEELRVLEIELGFQGWIEWNLVTQSASNRERAIACRKAPARWRWTNRDFSRSTAFVDRLYPGLYHGSWAHRCASSEGGHGPWVPNRQGSGAGGWLQFLSGTFWSVIGDAIDRARAHRVRIPSYARSWYSPLGQAIAGSEMLFRGRRGEWYGSTC